MFEGCLLGPRLLPEILDRRVSRPDARYGFSLPDIVLIIGYPAITRTNHRYCTNFRLQQDNLFISFIFVL